MTCKSKSDDVTTENFRMKPKIIFLIKTDVAVDNCLNNSRKKRLPNLYRNALKPFCQQNAPVPASLLSHKL